ncbi:MAG: hypothetical protein WDN10_04280 [bacterium]
MKQGDLHIWVRKLLQQLRTQTDSKEDLYTNILLWAHDKQESGFSWEEMRSKFSLNAEQEHWVRNIFLTTSDGDRKFFEHLRNDDSVSPNIYYYALNEKGITAAINYKGLRHAEKSSTQALWVASISIFLAAIGLFFTVKQTNLAETQSISERINQARSIQSALEFCQQNPDSQDSGLYEISTGKSASCPQVVRNYSSTSSLLDRIKSLFK